MSKSNYSKTDSPNKRSALANYDKGEKTIRNSSPDNSQFKHNIRELMNLNPNKIEENQEKKFFEYLFYFKNITKKSKYQLKLLDLGLLPKIIIPYLFSRNNNMENNSEAIKILVNIAKNKNHHFKFVPEDSVFKDLFNLLLLYTGTQVCNDILKVMLYLLENKDFLEKLTIINNSNNNNNTNNTSNKKEINFQYNNNIRIDNKLDIDVTILDMTRVLVEQVLDNLTCNDKLILLNIILHLYNFNHKLMQIESIEPISRCLASKDDEIIVAGLKILYLFSCPGVKIPVNNFSSNALMNSLLSSEIQTKEFLNTEKSMIQKNHLDENNTKRFHEELIKNNFVFRIVRVYKKSIPEIDSIIVLILYQLFKNNSLIDLLFSNNVNLMLENYLNSFDSDENDEVISTVFSIYKVIMLRNSSKITNLQKTLFEKALALSQKNMKKEKFVLNCLSMVEDVIKINVNMNKKEVIKFNKKNSITNNNKDENDNENQLQNILDNKSVKNVFEQIPIFFKSMNKEILHYSLNIFELVLREKLDYFEGNYIQVNDRNFSIKAMIFQLVHIINDNFSNDGIINSCCEICYMLSEIQVIHQYFLQEPHITILRVFCDDLIQIKEELMMKQDDETKLKKNDKDQISIGDRKNLSLIPRNFSVLSKKFNINEKIYKAKEQAKILRNGDQGSMLKQKSGKNLLLVETEYKLQKALKIIENLTKVSDNLEVMMNKGFLEIMNRLLENNNNPDTTNLVANCIQGFCGSIYSINIIISHNIIEKLLNFLSVCKKPSKLEVLLLAIKNILESNIKLQKQFILFDGISKVLKEIKLNDDRINNFVLKIVYVISCSINKLYLIDISGENSNFLNNKIGNNLNNMKEGEFNSKLLERQKSMRSMHIHKSSNNLIMLKNFDDDENNNNIHNKDSNINNANALNMLFNKLSTQLSETEFMEKLISIGFSNKTSLYTYKEFIKILINLYLNRFYLTYFTSDKNFDSILKIIEITLNSFNTMGIRSDIIKLILIFFKFISEEESLIKKFLEYKIINKILNYIHCEEFVVSLNSEDSEMIFYNITLILLRLTEYEGHIDKFNEIPNFFKSLIKLFNRNSVNGKVYILSIFKNLINEKFNFFSEDNILEFIDIVIETKSQFCIYEFIELLKILVQNRNLCNKMENVFKFLTNEINSPLHKETFKKYLLELILCLSYENSNIKNFSLANLLNLIQKLDLKLNKKTTLLILMNFSSVPQNFNYLVKGSNLDTQATIPKKNIKEIVDHLIDSDTFSQVLIQRFLINITSIENIDLSFISDKIFSTLIDAIVINEKIQDNLLICSLSILVNISNKSPLTLNSDLLGDNENKLGYTEDNETSFQSSPTKKKSQQKYNDDSDVDSDEDSKSESDSNINKEESKGELNNIDNKVLKLKNKIPKSQTKLSKKSSTSKKDKKSIKLLGSKYEDSSKSVTKRNDEYNTRNLFEDNESDENIKMLKTKKNRQTRFTTNNSNHLDDIFDSKKSKRPILGKYSDLGIVEFIISKFSNIVDIFNNLLNRSNLDIASLAIMLACNLSNQISIISKEKDEEISKKIESHFIENFNKLVFQQESGKFFLISIIKYCIFVSYDKNKVVLHKSFYEHILNMFMEVENKVVHIELNKEDFLSNTINYILIESLLKFLNITIELNHKLKLFKENTFTSIYDFYLKFLVKFTQILQELKLNIENNYNLQDLIISILHILITFLKQENFRYSDIEDHINSLIMKLISTTPTYLSEELKSIFIYFLYILINNDIDQKGLISKEETIKWIMKLFQLIDNSLQTDYYCLKLFSKAIKNQDEKLVNLIWKSSKFLFKLYKYITIFSNINSEDSIYEEKAINYNQIHQQTNNLNMLNNWNNNFNQQSVNMKNEEESKKENKENKLNNNSVITNMLLKTKEKNNNNAISNNNQTATLTNNSNFATKSILINSNINNAYKESRRDRLEKKSIIKKEAEKLINILSFNTKSHQKLIESGIYKHFKNNILMKYNPKLLSCPFHKEEFILIVNVFLNKDNTFIVKEDIPFLLPIIFLNKELNNNYKAQLFEIYLEDIITAERYFQEDYLKLFSVLYEGLKQNFSDIIFLLYSFMDKYELFASAIISDSVILEKIYNDYMIYDPNFPSEVSELALYIKIVEMYINSNIYDEKLQELIGNLNICLSRNSNKIKEISIVQIITQFLFMLFQKYHQVDLNLCNGDIEAVQKFTEKFNYNEIVTAIIKASISSKNYANIYFFIQEVLKNEENEFLLVGLNSSILFQKEFLFIFYGGIKDCNLLNKSNINNITNISNVRNQNNQISNNNITNNNNNYTASSIFNSEIINIKELVFFLNLTASLNRAKKLTFAEDLIVQVNDIYKKVFTIRENKISINPNNSNTVLEEALSSLFFYFDFLVEAKLNSSSFQKMMTYLCAITFNPTITEEYLIVYVRYLQEIISKFNINSKEDILIITSFLNKIKGDYKLSGFENSLVGTIILNSSKSVLINCLDCYLSILSLYISEYDSEKVYNFLEYFNQIYLSIVSEDKFDLIKKLQRYLMTALEKHDKELKKDTNFKKKLEKIAKQLYAY